MKSEGTQATLFAPKRNCKCGHGYGCHWGFTGLRNPCHHHNIETGEADCNCPDFEDEK